MSKARAGKSPADYFDFKAEGDLSTSFALDYLRQYYLPEREVTEDEKALYRFIKTIAGTMPKPPRALEVGCGPTMHHAIMLAPFVEKIDLADHLEENLAVVETWRKGGPEAWDWTDYSIYCSQEDGIEPNESAILEREALTRKRIGEVSTVDLLAREPLGPNPTLYDLVGAFYCTEEIALTAARWKEVMRGVHSLIKPGGCLLLSCLANTDYYDICAADGTTRPLPCARISREDIGEMLDELGFDKKDRIIVEHHTPEQESEGVPGVFLAFARREG